MRTTIGRGRALLRAPAIACVLACAALAASCGGGGGSPAREPPSVTTLAAVTISETEEALSGSVSPNGKDTEYWFEWGEDERLLEPFRTSPSPLGATATARTVTATLNGLPRGAHRHWRVAARNEDGTALGDVKPLHHYASVVFVTSARGTGELASWPDAAGRTGLAAGDAVCQTLADRAGLQGGPFLAWLSDPSTSPSRRLRRSAGPYVRADGARVAASWTAMTSPACAGGIGPCLERPISTDERGAIGPETGVYTNTRPDGSPYGASCDRWARGADFYWSPRGYSLSSDARWTFGAEVRCSAPLALYCFQQNAAVPQEPFSTGCLWAGRVPWAVFACGNGVNQDPGCAAVCCGFWAMTLSCYRVPAAVGAYTVTSCQAPSPGLYTLSATGGGRGFTVSCRTWEPGTSFAATAASVVPPPGFPARVRMLVDRALGSR